MIKVAYTVPVSLLTRGSAVPASSFWVRGGWRFAFCAHAGMYLLFAHTTGIIGPQLTSDNLYPLTWEDVTRGNEIQTVFASLGVMTVILLLLTLYLDQVIPRGTSGVAVPWYVPFQRVFCCGRSPCCGRHKKKPSRVSIPTP